MKTERTARIDTLQKRHPGCRRQRNDHGCGVTSVEFFRRADGRLVARYEFAGAQDRGHQTL